MIEIVVREWIERQTGVPAVMEIPADPPKTMVLVKKVDTDRENRLDAARFMAESYAPSLLEAAKLNQKVKAAMDALPELPEVSGSHLVTDYPAPDVKNKRYRYQAVYKIYHYCG